MEETPITGIIPTPVVDFQVNHLLRKSVDIRLSTFFFASRSKKSIVRFDKVIRSIFPNRTYGCIYTERSILKKQTYDILKSYVRFFIHTATLAITTHFLIRKRPCKPPQIIGRHEINTTLRKPNTMFFSALHNYCNSTATLRYYIHPKGSKIYLQSNAFQFPLAYIKNFCVFCTKVLRRINY